MTYTEPREHWTAEIGELRTQLQPTRKTRAQRQAAKKAQLREMREAYHREMAKVLAGGRASWEKAAS